MAEFKLRKQEIIILTVLGGALFLESLILVLLIYFAKFPIFIALFVRGLRICSPIFFLGNVISLIVNIFVRGRKLISTSWTAYLLELLKFSVLSFLITLALITISALTGALIVFLLRRISYLPTVDAIITSLREWVARNFY